MLDVALHKIKLFETFINHYLGSFAKEVGSFDALIVSLASMGKSSSCWICILHGLSPSRQFRGFQLCAQLEQLELTACWLGQG